MERQVNDRAWASFSLWWAAVLTLGTTVLDGAQAADLPDGRKVFRERCALCHSVRSLMPPLRNRLPSDREDFLGRFLENHHTSNPTERKAVATYLNNQAGR
jgi:mono/diheme cytochrome c family protein